MSAVGTPPNLSATTVLVVESERKGSFERTRSRWDVNIKMYLIFLGCGDANWETIAQNGEQ
jgi:hypothetical protein